MASKIDTPEGREWVVGMLKGGPIKIIFTKKDGTERIMSCTLKSELIEDYQKKTERVKEPNPDICAVYDLDLKAWRSFRFDSVKAVSFDL